MATAVQIELQVDEKGAVSGVRNVDTAVKGITPTAQQLNATLEKLNITLEQMGKKGKKAAGDTADGIKKTGIEALGSTEKMRLLEESMGVRVPRAMLKLAASSKIAQTAISAVGMGIVGLGAIEMGGMVFAQIYDGAKKLYEEVLDVNKSVDEYIQKAGDAANQKLFDTASLETANDLLREANRQIANLEEKRNHYVDSNVNIEGMGSGMYPGAVPLRSFTPKDDKEEGVQLKNRDAALARVDELSVQSGEKDIQAENSFASATARAWERANVEKQSAIKLAQKHLEITQAHEKTLYATTRALRAQQDAENRIPENERIEVHQVDPNAGKSEYDQDVKAGTLRGRAEDIAFGRQKQEEEIRLHNEAVDAALRGDALYKAQADQQIEDLTRHHLISATAVNDIWAKFHNEQIQRMKEEDRKVQEMRGQTRLAGSTGTFRVLQEEKNRVTDIQTDPDQSLNSGQRLAEINEIHKQTVQQIAELNESFSERVDEIAGQAASRELTGFAKIRVDAENQIQALTREFKDKGGKQPDLDRGIAAIKQSAGDQSVEMMRQMTDETATIEAEARARSLTGERQKTAQIDAEYRARIQGYEAWKNKELESDKISEKERQAILDNANLREVAAAKERDAQKVEASRAAREKMAGEFDHMFKSLDHPLQALAEMGDKVAGEAAASLVQRVQQHYHKDGAPQPAGGGGGLFGNMLGDFGFGGHGKKGSVPVSAAAVPAHPGAPETASSGMFSVSSAIIRVASGSLSFGGGATGAGAIAGVPGGGTTLLGSPLPVHGASGTQSSGTSSLPSQHSFGTSSGAGLVGGAGDSTASGGGSFTLGGGTPPPRGGGMVSAVNDTSQGLSLYQQSLDTFGGGSSSGSGSGSANVQHDALPGKLNDDGSFTSAKSGNGGLIGGSETEENVMGAAQGSLGLYSAYEGNGGVGGALSGAMSGMKLGMALGGPMGAAIGAAAGAIVGAIGFGGREKARVYDLKTVRPRIANDIDGFQQGSMDYLSAYGDMESAQTDANHTVSKMGPAANSYYQDTIKPEIATAEQKLSREAKAGRSASTFSAAQYDTGGAIDNFGDLNTSPDHGLVHAQLGEFVVKPNVYQRNKSTMDALNSGVSMDAIHASYQNTMQSKSAASTSGGDRTVNMHIYAHDSKSVAQFFDDNMHHVRRALSSSYSSYGGLADA